MGVGVMRDQKTKTGGSKLLVYSWLCYLLWMTGTPKDRDEVFIIHR
jgi:hypothetical protein